MKTTFRKLLMEDKYNTYGSDFFEDHWDGRFLFMVNYF